MHTGPMTLGLQVTWAEDGGNAPPTITLDEADHLLSALASSPYSGGDALGRAAGRPQTREGGNGQCHGSHDRRWRDWIEG